MKTSFPKQSNLGFSLSEIVVVMAISSIVMSALVGLAIWGAAEFRRIQGEIEAQREVLRLETTLRQYVGQAVNVSSEDLVQGGVAMGAGQGIGRFHANAAGGNPQVWDEISDFATPIVTIGVFLREWGFFPEDEAVTNLFSQPVATGIFLAAPVAGTPTGTTGVLFIDPGAAGGGAALGGGVSPDYGDIFFAGITSFRFQKELADRDINGPVVAGGRTQLKAVTFGYSIRFHIADATNLTWCPNEDVVNGLAGCTPGSPFFDVEREVRVVLHNNDLTPPITGPVTLGVGGPAAAWILERPAGFLHFFRPVFPEVW